MYVPDDDDHVTNLFRLQARQEELIDAFLASLAAADARRELIPFRHQREFVTRRRVQPFRTP
jgi:hypothetical protein